MMKVYKYPGKDQWQELTQRPTTQHDGLEKKVRKILRQVKSKGDKAIRKLTAELDGRKLKKFEVTRDEITKSSANVSEALKKAIGVAYANIEKFHQAQREEIKRIETIPGITCWRRAVPIEKSRIIHTRWLCPTILHRIDAGYTRIIGRVQGSNTLYTPR